MSGVYQIYNPINNKRYIGSSINVERRLKEHLRNLKKNTHCNVHLQYDTLLNSKMVDAIKLKQPLLK